MMRLHDIILSAWECAFSGSKVAYLSGPITTGKRQIDRIRARDNSDYSKSELIGLNSNILVETAKRLRAELGVAVVEPGSLTVRDWSQADYLELWERFIEKQVRLIYFMPEWEYSVGCATEFARAVKNRVRTETVSGSLITIEDALILLRDACDDLASDNADGVLTGLSDSLASIVEELERNLAPTLEDSRGLRKDASLDFLAESGMNVAQFVSFSPNEGGPRQEFSRVAGREANAQFLDVRTAAETLLASSVDGMVNVRSYQPFDAQSREFIYGLSDVAEIVGAIERLSTEGLHTIMNETVDVNDGGVSGVLMGDILEFAPDDTPRCVEKPGTASLSRVWGRELLSTVYQFPVDLNAPMASRLEFSIHPKPRGWKQTNTLCWEFEDREVRDISPHLQWPNKFSSMLGDKAFGLLVAHHIGLPVPYTKVINRRVAPFSFGKRTGAGESWIRTAPTEQVPGKFTTHRGWIDPFELLHREDPNNVSIASVLSQDGVKPEYSGAVIARKNLPIAIEGKKGEGESLMQGTSLPEDLPSNVLADVKMLYKKASAVLGPVRFEWVFDGTQAWIVQLHKGETNSTETQLTPGKATNWIRFEVSQGLEALRDQISTIEADTGIELIGRVGLTSHIADVIRKANIPSRITI